MLLVETAGEFQLLEPDSGVLVAAHRPTVITPGSSFFESRVAAGQLRVLAELTDEATDSEFVEYVSASDGKVELAVESFKSKYAGRASAKADKPEKAEKAEKAPKAAKDKAS